MNCVFRLIVVLCGIIAGGSFQTSQSVPVHSPFAATVVGVSDGDTAVVRTPDAAEYRIRLEGVDCPELEQPFGESARAATLKMLGGKSVTIHVFAVDRNNRIVSRIIADGMDVSLELIRNGLAWHSTEFSSDTTLATAEKEARAARRGLWVEPDPIPPWVFRKKSSSGGPSHTVAKPAPTGPFRGNVRSRVFHAPGCRNYACQSCIAEFQTMADAQAAGYRAAADCFRGH